MERGDQAVRAAEVDLGEAGERVAPVDAQNLAEVISFVRPQRRQRQLADLRRLQCLTCAETVYHQLSEAACANGPALDTPEEVDGATTRHLV